MALKTASASLLAGMADEAEPEECSPEREVWRKCQQLRRELAWHRQQLSADLSIQTHEENSEETSLIVAGDPLVDAGLLGAAGPGRTSSASRDKQHRRPAAPLGPEEGPRGELQLRKEQQQQQQQPSSPSTRKPAAWAGSKLPMVEPGKKPTVGASSRADGMGSSAVKSPTTGMTFRCGRRSAKAPAAASR